MTYILTRSGVEFDFISAQPDDIVLSDIAWSLSRLRRFTGHALTPYTVANHSAWCSRLAADRSLDLQTQRWCLMHDAAEAYLGDVASPLKALLPDYQAIEKRVTDLIRVRFRLGTCPSVVHRIDREALEWEFEHVFDAVRPVDTGWADFMSEANRLEIV